MGAVVGVGVGGGLNMLVEEVTEVVSQLSIDWLKAAALKNMASVVMAALMSQLAIGWLNIAAA